MVLVSSVLILTTVTVGKTLSSETQEDMELRIVALKKLREVAEKMVDSATVFQRKNAIFVDLFGGGAYNERNRRPRLIKIRRKAKRVPRKAYGGGGGYQAPRKRQQHQVFQTAECT